MHLDLHHADTWVSHLLETLPEEKIVSSLKEDSPDWEYIDGEIVKLGSLAHGQLDIAEIQRRGLILLASESKDFRLLAHLLRTLQHAGNPQLALHLLSLYVEHYWTVAAPQTMAHKKRFAGQVLKRFEPGIAGFAQSADSEQRDALLGELVTLARCWQAHDLPDLAQATEDLLTLYQREFRDAASTPSVEVTPRVLPKTVASPQEIPLNASATTTTLLAPRVIVDSHDDIAWRDTQLNVAAILCEREPDSPLGFCLRRHAIWQTITGTPQAESDGRTPLAAVAADRVTEYQTRLASADLALWEQVENSLLLAPYWIDGHYLSAQIALQLGYCKVADAIRDEVIRFHARLPLLSCLLFNDRTPFISDPTKQWLASHSARDVAQTGEELQAARACFAEQGLEAALRYLDSLPEGSPRERFYLQYSAAQLMEEAGMATLAQQQYRVLFTSGSRMMLADWEPSLLEQLEHKFMAEQ